MSTTELTTQVMAPDARRVTHWCSIPSCFHVRRTRGLCGKHYQRLAKYGDPLATMVPRKAGGS